MTWEEWVELKSKILELERINGKHLMVFQDEVRFSICNTTILGLDITGSVWVYYADNTCSARIKIGEAKTPQQLFNIVEALQ